MRLLHTMLRVGDLQRSINFYTNVLGMTLLRTSENPEYKYCWHSWVTARKPMKPSSS